MTEGSNMSEDIGTIYSHDPNSRIKLSKVDNDQFQLLTEVGEPGVESRTIVTLSKVQITNLIDFLAPHATAAYRTAYDQLVRAR